MYRAPRGTTDILPQEQKHWNYVRNKASALCDLYGYRRIDTPTFEDARLFVRSIGEETDIVEKETYTFDDRSGDKLTLRPEGTASVCRSYLEHGMHTLPQPVRLYYYTSIFRYERPQAGRYREHHQFGIEAIGEADPALDAEVIEMAWQFGVTLGLTGLSLFLNSIGCNECRPLYLESLKKYYDQNKRIICADCRRRLEVNPLRLLDCKKPSCVPLTDEAPRSTDYLCVECTEHFDELKKHLKLLKLPFIVNHRLVRGLDYYTKTVFEISPEGEVLAQATVCGGGRYDNLIEQLGGKPTPGIGFAAGIERLVINLKRQKLPLQENVSPPVYIAYIGQKAKNVAVKLTSDIRRTGFTAILAFGDRSLKAQLKQANSSGARYTVIIGDEEVRSKTVILRDMDKAEQKTLSLDDVIETLAR